MHFSPLKTTWMLYFKFCHLEEMDVILCVWKLLQLSISPLQLSNLLLQSLQESFSPTHLSLLLSSDQLFHLRAPSLNGADHLSEDPVTVLHCCLCRALLGNAQRGGGQETHRGKWRSKLTRGVTGSVWWCYLRPNPVTHCPSVLRPIWPKLELHFPLPPYLYQSTGSNC